MTTESLDGLILGRALAMLRISRGLSQKQLAGLVGTTAGVIWVRLFWSSLNLSYFQ